MNLDKLTKVCFAMVFSFCIISLCVIGIASCILQEKDGYQPPPITEKQSEPVWKWKTITAEYKGIDCGRVIVYDTEDDMTFKYSAQDLGLGMYLKMKNSPVGTKVKIEVDSLVDESTGEVLERQSYKLWL